MTDEIRLFEKLILESFQAGLSWLTILKKRENFRRAFVGFDPEKLVRFGDRDVKRLMTDAGIVRNEKKIRAAIKNARSFLNLRDHRGLASTLWGCVEGRPIRNTFSRFEQVPAETEISRKMSELLKANGFVFVGPTTMYAFMQSTGMVNDHLVDCHRYTACCNLQKSVKIPVS